MYFPGNMAVYELVSPSLTVYTKPFSLDVPVRKLPYCSQSHVLFVTHVKPYPVITHQILQWFPHRMSGKWMDLLLYLLFPLDGYVLSLLRPVHGCDSRLSIHIQYATLTWWQFKVMLKNCLNDILIIVITHTISENSYNTYFIRE